MGEGGRRSFGDDVGERQGEVSILPGDDARFCMPGVSGAWICMGDDMGRGLIIRTGLLLGESARASNVYEVSMIRFGVGDCFGLSVEDISPLIFLLFIPARVKTLGTHFGLPMGDIMGEALGVHGDRGVRGDLGVPGVSVSELSVDDNVLKFEGETRDSVEAEPNMLAIHGARSFPLLDDSR